MLVVMNWYLTDSTHIIMSEFQQVIISCIAPVLASLHWLHPLPSPSLVDQRCCLCSFSAPPIFIYMYQKTINPYFILLGVCFVKGAVHSHGDRKLIQIAVLSHLIHHGR